MIITRTPHRLSLVGGGTDHPAWYNEHPGACIGFAVKLYCYVALRALPPYFPGYRHRFSWSRIELLDDHAASTHPAMRAVFADKCVEEGLEVHHFADVPARAGLGSSSAFVVGLLNALGVYRSGTADERAYLAREAIRLERDVMRETVGDQDQYLCALGGVNRLDFAVGEPARITPLAISAHILDHLTLFYTGLQRNASEIEARKVARKKDLTYLYNLVDETEGILVSGDPCRLGEIFNFAWEVKRSLDPAVTNDHIDSIYKCGIAAGATGGRLVGAGGGGFFLFCRSPDKAAALSAALSGLIEVRPEIDHEGTKVLPVNGET
jgi:D-glycero-alpha-D-manno-heptose-7-phosphate kinase